uniref:Uncharacterized protein n=1 Tax=Ovis aries TaxID=9940 RepID=A0AC11DMI1_SHEEP
MEVKGKEQDCPTHLQEALGRWKPLSPALGHSNQEPIIKAGPGLLQPLLCLPAKVCSLAFPSALRPDRRKSKRGRDQPHWRAEETEAPGTPTWLYTSKGLLPAEAHLLCSPLPRSSIPGMLVALRCPLTAGSGAQAQPSWWRFFCYGKIHIKSRLPGEINNLRYADDTTLIAESEEELKSLLMKVKVESEKVGLKLNVQKTKIIASGPITSWEIDGKQWKQCQTLFWGAPKSLQMMSAAIKLKDAYSLEEKL